jgi:GrpB-like predicted nucleotidyltransferase (UPF0157 family)
MIRLVEYDPAWPARYEESAARIGEALGEVARRIDHVGSTSVPGLVAKPYIDIQVSVAGLDRWDTYGPALERLGLAYVPDDEPDHRFFAGEDLHVHVCEAGGDWEHRHVAFRDLLRSDPKAAATYEREKRRLAAQFDDVHAYTDAKTPVIRRLERQAGVPPA